MKKSLILICLVACMTSACTSFSDIYSIKQNNKIGFINKNGKEIISPKYDDVIVNNNAPLIAVKFNGLWGFIDRNGEFKIIPQYKSTKGFINGLAYVVDDNYEGYITSKGDYVWKQVKTKNNVVSNAQNHTKTVTTVKNDLADSILNELGL